MAKSEGGVRAVWASTTCSIGVSPGAQRYIEVCSALGREVVFVYLEKLQSHLRNKGSRDYKDKVFEQFMGGDFGERDPIGEGIVLDWGEDWLWP